MAKVDGNMPTEEEIGDLLRRIQPHPEAGFNRRMAKQPWNRGGRASFGAGFTSMRAAATLGLVLLLALGGSLFSPALNTLAQHFTQFFLPSAGSQISPAIAPLETSHPLERFNLSRAEAEALAGFQMKTVAPAPDGFRLFGTAYDQLREAIILHYSTATGGLVLRISQQELDTEYQRIGPEAVVEMVPIGAYTGEFVTGGWMIPEVESGADATPSPATSQTVWDANVNLQTLRWSDGEFLYEIILAGGSQQPGYIDKDGLIALANRMH